MSALEAAEDLIANAKDGLGPNWVFSSSGKILAEILVGIR